MAKKILQRCMTGAPWGLALQILMIILHSYRRGNGEVYQVSAWLLDIYGTERNAFSAECTGAMLVGMLWAAASLIFRETDWSLLKQTAVHFAGCMGPSLGIGFGLHWLPRNWYGLSQCLLLFGLIYVVNWAVQFLWMRRRVKQMNAQLKEIGM